MREYEVDLDLYIQTLKRAVAFDFFKLIKLRNTMLIYDKAYKNKQKYLYGLLNSIESLWDKEVLKVGDKIRYWHSQYEQREGTVIGFSSLYSLNDTVEIRSPKNRKIIRQLNRCRWDNRFRDTLLFRKMANLLTMGNVPEEWSEKKVNFYD